MTTKGLAIVGRPPVLPLFLGFYSGQAAVWVQKINDGWEDWGGTSPCTVTVVKKYGSGVSKLLVTCGYNLFLDLAADVQFQARIHDGTTGFGTTTYYLNREGRQQCFTISTTITTLGPGSHTLTLQIDLTADSFNLGDDIKTDSNNCAWMHVFEVPA